MNQNFITGKMMEKTEISTPDALWRPMTQHQMMRGKDAPARSFVERVVSFLMIRAGNISMDWLGYGVSMSATAGRNWLMLLETKWGNFVMQLLF